MLILKYKFNGSCVRWSLTSFCKGEKLRLFDDNQNYIELEYIFTEDSYFIFKVITDVKLIKNLRSYKYFFGKDILYSIGIYSNADKFINHNIKKNKEKLIKLLFEYHNIDESKLEDDNAFQTIMRDIKLKSIVD